MRYRIISTDKGWVVEHLTFKYSFLGLHFCRVWRPYVKVTGLDQEWAHQKKKYAIMNFIHEIRKDTYGIWMDGDWQQAKELF